MLPHRRSYAAALEISEANANARSYESARALLLAFRDGRIRRRLLSYEQALISIAYGNRDVLIGDMRDLSYQQLRMRITYDEMRAADDLVGI